MAWRTPDFVWEAKRNDALVGDHLSADWPEVPLRNLLSPGLTTPGMSRTSPRDRTSPGDDAPSSRRRLARATPTLPETEGHECPTNSTR